MRIYFDTEFTGLHKDTTLVSIGLISENGKTFYAELTDYDKTQCDKWITENVIDNLLLTRKKRSGNNADQDFIGTKRYVSKQLREWLQQFSEVQLVSDVCHYDMVLFIDLFGNAFDLPKHVSPCCYDINQDIAKWLKISQSKAFDLSRERIVSLKGNLPSGRKHNALYDAKVIKEIYDIIHTKEEK